VQVRRGAGDFVTSRLYALQRRLLCHVQNSLPVLQMVHDHSAFAFVLSLAQVAYLNLVLLSVLVHLASCLLPEGLQQYRAACASRTASSILAIFSVLSCLVVLPWGVEARTLSLVPCNAQKPNTVARASAHHAVKELLTLGE